MIRRFEIEGLYGKISHCIEFKPDINILTGQNGSGKTTLLKVLWSLISSNRGSILFNTHFIRARIVTDKYTLEVLPNVDNIMSGPRIAKYSLIEQDSDPEIFELLYDTEGFIRNSPAKVQEMNDRISQFEEKSIYFPTFRRIEGGFSIFDDPRYPRVRPSRRYEIAYAIDAYSDQLSDSRHKFVSSISTSDIERKLQRINNSINLVTNQLYLTLSRDIEKKLSLRHSSSDSADSTRVLSEIEVKLEEVKLKCAELRRPLEELSNLVHETFKDGGVSIQNEFVLGDEANAVPASSLSAGEKQLLSFLTYNAFARDTVIFIDEPELNLHVDWQRSLFSKLLKQESSNQFIVTTHSPFIYTRYPQNEYFLDANRGWDECNCHVNS